MYEGPDCPVRIVPSGQRRTAMYLLIHNVSPALSKSRVEELTKAQTEYAAYSLLPNGTCDRPALIPLAQLSGLPKGSIPLRSSP